MPDTGGKTRMKKALDIGMNVAVGFEMLLFGAIYIEYKISIAMAIVGLIVLGIGIARMILFIKG
jgi:hypothetical protein